MNPPARPARTGRSRRAVRPSGTVGQDETVLRSVHPAPTPGACAVRPGTDRPGADEHRTDGPPASPALVTRPAAGSGDADEESALPVRSLDDGDLGWGGHGDDSNDDRLRQDVPPHW